MISQDWLDQFNKNSKCGEDILGGSPTILTGLALNLYDYMFCKESTAFVTAGDEYSPTLQVQYEEMKCSGAVDPDKARLFIAKCLEAAAVACNG